MSNLAQPIIIPAAAVDVGHFSTKFTLGRATNNGEIKVSQFPSEAVPLPGGLDDLPMSRKPSGFLVTVKGAPYFIGQDVDTLGGAHGARSVADDFVRTPAYYALFLGALGYIARAYGATSRLIIKNLVVGLPMTTFSSLNGELHTLVQGVHNVPVNNGEQVCKVEISQVTVLPPTDGHAFQCGFGQNPARAELHVAGSGHGWWHL